MNRSTLPQQPRDAPRPDTTFLVAFTVPCTAHVIAILTAAQFSSDVRGWWPLLLFFYFVLDVLCDTDT